MDNDTSTDDYTRAVAKLLTQAKKASGKSFDALAAETGLGRATVVRILAGERPITVGYLRALSAALDLNASAVLNEADEHL